MKVYAGRRVPGLGVHVTVNGRHLFPPRSLRIGNGTRMGFEWGYTGNGPAFLALAILFNLTGSRVEAEEQYLSFERQFVSRWGAEWEISEEQIRDWLMMLGTRTA